MDTRPFTWSRFGGYEVSSKGDSRFSALFARMENGQTLEVHYQCYPYPIGKGYGGFESSDWRAGKGKPALIPLPTDAYVNLWRTWAQHNLPLMRELYVAVRRFGDGCTLSDRFATSQNNQARALSIVLNELCGY